MKRFIRIFSVILSIALLTSSCSEDDVGPLGVGGGEVGEGMLNETGGGEAGEGMLNETGGGEAGEGSGGIGEESGTQLAIDQTYDELRNGMRLIMSYDILSNSFIGTVENTTNAIIPQVRVEVHLSNGTELGPTPRVDLARGEVRDVVLQATTTPFASWSAHPEAG